MGLSHQGGRIWRPAAIVLGAAVLLCVLAAAITLTVALPARFARYVPDGPAFTLHAGLGTALNAGGLSASAAANQWVRAAAHATSADQLEVATHGIATTRQSSGYDWQIDDQLCSSFVGGGESTREALRRAGSDCSDDPTVFTHVSEGTPIVYSSRPPIGGEHYPTWYPAFGLTDEPIAPGYWVHNLEHGAVVLLYRCPDGCTPDRLEALRAVYDGLPRGDAAPRLLITRADDIDTPYAVAAWGHKLLLASLDARAIGTFYERFVNRGPECRNLLCP